MNKILLHLIAVTAIVLCSCSDNTPTIALQIKSCAAMPAPRASASACAYEGKIYVFGGRDAKKNYQNDLWQYDPGTDTWQQLSSCPGKARVKAVMAAHEGSLYIGLGFSGEKVYVDSCYLRDVWRYTPADDQWTKLSDSPYPNTIGGVPCVSDGRLFVLYSTGWSQSKDIIFYDIANNRWGDIPDTGKRPGACFGATGVPFSGRFFFGTGLTWRNTKQWYEVDVANDQWTPRASYPGKGRELCASCATTEYIYLFGGRCFAGEYTGGEVFGEIMRYCVDTDQWEHCGDMPCGKTENMVAVSINNIAYFGLGEDEKGTIRNTWYRIEK
jgi:N-acetylneuraminic acid mutarotase